MKAIRHSVLEIYWEYIIPTDRKTYTHTGAGENSIAPLYQVGHNKLRILCYNKNRIINKIVSGLPFQNQFTGMYIVYCPPP